jgi:hypothetical protein
MNRAAWIRRAFALKKGLFENYPTLRRATCTIPGSSILFDWRRGDKITTSKLGRGVKAAVYVSGLARIDDT